MSPNSVITTAWLSEMMSFPDSLFLHQAEDKRESQPAAELVTYLFMNEMGVGGWEERNIMATAHFLSPRSLVDGANGTISKYMPIQMLGLMEGRRNSLFYEMPKVWPPFKLLLWLDSCRGNDSLHCVFFSLLCSWNFTARFQPYTFYGALTTEA